MSSVSLIVTDSLDCKCPVCSRPRSWMSAKVTSLDTFTIEAICVTCREVTTITVDGGLVSQRDTREATTSELGRYWGAWMGYTP